jgi:hypothetical protein
MLQSADFAQRDVKRSRTSSLDPGAKLVWRSWSRLCYTSMVVFDTRFSGQLGLDNPSNQTPTRHYVSIWNRDSFSLGSKKCLILQKEVNPPGCPYPRLRPVMGSFTQRHVKRHGPAWRSPEISRLCGFLLPHLSLRFWDDFLGVECRPNPGASHRRSRTPRAG